MRDRILTAAARMMVAGGTEASMASIAKCAGVATGSLYNHFPSKEVLVEAVCEEVANALAASVVLPLNEAQDGRERLEAYIDNYIDFIWENAERALLFEYVSNLPVIASDRLLSMFSASAHHVAEILEALRKEGLTPYQETAVSASFIGGAIRNTLKWRRLAGRDLTDETRQQIRQMCLAAVLGTA